jgi:hypothetical protein
VSAPFRVLGSVLGAGERDLGEIRFEPGSIALTPPAEEDVARIAKALQARPRLELAIRGGYDPEADAAALRRGTVRRAIAQRAGVPADAPLDFGNPKVLHAAENLYMERAGSRLEMQALRDAAGWYPRALMDKLAAVTPVDPEAVRTLARARAETVRAQLLTHGVDPARLGLAGPVQAQAGKEGVATQLALQAGGGASAGPTK